MDWPAVYVIGTSALVAGYVLMQGPRHLLRHCAVVTVLGYLWMAIEGVVAGAASKTVAIHDTGFILTQPLYDWLARQDVAVLHGFSFINTLLCQILSGGVVVYEGIFCDNVGLGYGFTLIHLLRQICGVCTLLPTPPQLLKSPWDFPNAVSGNYIFLFSGHQAVYAMYSTWLFMQRRYFACFVSVVLAVISCLFMVVTRGHYTLDLTIGTFVGVVAAVHQSSLESLAGFLVGPTKSSAKTLEKRS